MNSGLIAKDVYLVCFFEVNCRPPSVVTSVKNQENFVLECCVKNQKF